MGKLLLNKSTDLYNLILGGLIALSSEQKVGKLARKVSSENTFLGKWLKRAKKQKCYPKSISADIDKLLQTYLNEGPKGNLASLFRKTHCEYQLLKAMPKQFSQTDKQRFDNAMKDLASEGWFITLPIEHSKNSAAPYRPTKAKEIFTTKWYWKGVFDEEKNLTKFFSIFVVSTPQAVINCLYEHGFILVRGLTTHDCEGNDYYQFQIFPMNDYCGDVAIPSKFKIYL